MTFDDVRAAGKVALCQLSGGVQLRYDASDNAIRHLPYPGVPALWREASAYEGPIPADGWSHYPGCGCDVCTSEREMGRGQQEERASA